MSGPARIVVTGASGAAGSHLCELALARGAHVLGLANRGPFVSGIDARVVDVTDPHALAAVLAPFSPDRVFHLAARVHGSGVHPPDAILRVNIEGTYHVLEAVRATAPNARVLVAASSGIYAPPADSATPLDEGSALQCRSIYAVSKAAQDLLAEQAFLAHGQHVVRVRTFNQTGPREPQGLVCATLARQIARIEAGLQAPVLRVDTLDASRDFCDVRDVVAGYWAALENGSAGAAYNVCSGRSYSIRRVVDILLSLARVSDVRVEVSAPRAGAGIDAQVGDASRLTACSGWRPQISLETSLADLLDEWRAREHA